MKTVLPVVASNGVSSLQMRSVGSHSTSGKEKEGKNGSCYPWSHDCGEKIYKLMWWFYQLLSGFLAKGQLPRVSRLSHGSLMIRVIMK